jgi:hypothetical protein
VVKLFDDEGGHESFFIRASNRKLETASAGRLVVVRN